MIVSAISNPLLAQTLRPASLHSELWLGVGAVLGYALLMFTNPIRASLRDGLRCVQRYGSIWGILAVFGLCYALFELALRVFYFYELPEGAKPLFQWHRAFLLPNSAKLEILRGSILPAAESVAGVFNCIATTYPFSALAALLLLGNYDGHHGVLNRALRKRFGFWGWLLYFGISVCALAAVAKPCLYVLLPYLNHFAPGLLLVQGSLVIDWLSFLFEYLFGVCIQIYLMLIVFAWVRGISFTHRNLLDVAIRRFSFVMRWAVVVMAASSLAIHWPLILSNVEPFSHWLSPEATIGYIDRWARPVLAALLILFSAMQITLTFHSESVGKALRDHFQFALRNWWSLAWYLVIAALHFFALTAFNQGVIEGWGEGTALTTGWRFVYPLLAAVVGAWMLATWVCLYKRCEAGRARPDNWIKF
jgi:hypothetical protein